VQAELARRRRLLVSAADCPVVELGRLGDASLPLPAGRFTIVGVAELARADDPAALLQAARQALPSDGRLLLFEPYRRARWVGTLTGLVAPLVRRCTGLRVDLPTVALVRRAGFVIATVERVSMPTLIAPLRSFCLVVGHPADGAAPSNVAAGEAAR